MFFLTDDFDVTQNIKLIEKLKSELLASVSELFCEMTEKHDINDLAETFADIIIFNYILADRLGINNSVVNMKAVNKLKLNIVRKNILYTESVNLLRHIERGGGK